ncbi:MAG: hypothetical protein H6657_14850 [Ardenticatenaceae bacterium]|nr:hypothetical protein [Ardenticatenaceae bacterium]
MGVVIVYGQRSDAHVLSVIEALETRQREYVLFERFRHGYRLSYEFVTNKSQVLIHTPQKVYDLASDIDGIYWRHTAVNNAEKGLIHQSTYRDILRSSEWGEASRALSLQEEIKIKHVNPVSREIIVSNKIYQLILAKRNGLRIPNSFVSNDKVGVQGFNQVNKPLIIKSLAPMFDERTDGGIPTELYNPFEAVEGEIAFSPKIYQPYIEKAYELRVIVVDSKIFTVKINSQNHADTEIDWRKAAYHKDLFEEGELSFDTSRRLLNFHKNAGIIYAAYDFIVDTEGVEYFLECNPHGNWLFLNCYLKEIGLAIVDYFS